VTLRDLHADFAWVVVVTNAVVGIWALAVHYEDRLPGDLAARFRTPALWWATGVAQVTMVVEVCLGVALVAVQDYDVEPFHTLYGFSGIAAIGILYSYRDQIGRHRVHLLYGLGGLFMMGLALRAITISPILAP
jgi:hypothetical protein